MSLVLDQLEGEAIRLSPTFPLVLTPGGVVLPGLHGLNDLECTFPILLVLERLARRDPVALGTVISEVVALTGADAEDLRQFAGQLAFRSHVRPTDDAVDAAVEDAPTAPFSGDLLDPTLPFVLPTPLILGLTADGFEKRDHENRVELRLSAVELEAASRFCAPTTVEKALKNHRKRSGGLALESDAFEQLAARLFEARILRQFDPDDLSIGRSYNREAEEQNRERAGRAAVGAAMDRSMARLDVIEKERRDRGLTARTKVFPVHSIPTDWRNPPLSLGLILAYAKTYEDGRLEESYDLRPDWMLDAERIEPYLDEPSIYMFSSYIWSSADNLELSKFIKERNPLNITIHGGPNVPKYEADVVAYFADNPHVDITVRGEGEITAVELLDALAGRFGDGPVDLSVLDDVAGLCYRDGDRVVRTADRDRLTELDIVPSPYLTGVFDTYVEGWDAIADSGATGTDGWAYKLPVVVLETNRGCPYGCTFCDWGSATTSRIRKYSIERIFAEIEWCANNKVDTIGLADANFGIFERDVEITEKVANSKIDLGYPKQFGTNYAKNSVKHLKQIVEELARADILSFGLLSLQSMDADTLNTISRSNIKLEKYEELAAEFQRAKLPLYVDLMVGLPGQTLPSFQNDLQECINREVHAKVFQTQLLVNSPMNEPSYREEHGITTKPGLLVLESASFTRDEYEDMLRSRRVFYLLEKFGILRHVARYVRYETGVREIDFFERLWQVSKAEPLQWPLINFALNALHRYMVPPVSWSAWLDEVRRFLVQEVGIIDDDALDTVIAVQHALLPDRERQFPLTVELPHDYVAWHASMIESKQSGHLDDWTLHIRPLRELPPGTLTIEDNRQVCRYEMGRHAEINPWDAWDLDSPISRPVALQN